MPEAKNYFGLLAASEGCQKKSWDQNKVKNSAYPSEGRDGKGENQ